MIPYNILGVPVSPYSKHQFLNAVEVHLENPHSDPLFIVTVNPEIAVQAIFDDEFREILRSSGINTADGVGISWAVKHLYKKEIDRITGSDSLEELCKLAARQRQSVFFYGAAPTIAEQAAAILEDRIPQLRFSGTFSPDKPDLSFNALPLTTQVELKQASVVFVALGAPAQEKWIHRNLQYLPACRVIIGVGGSFDFIAGTVKRAPVIFRRTGFEWVYRLWLQPSRWRRMMKLPLFAFNIILLKTDFRSLNAAPNK